MEVKIQNLEKDFGGDRECEDNWEYVSDLNEGSEDDMLSDGVKEAVLEDQEAQVDN